MEKPQDIIHYNRNAWDNLVRTGNRWTVPFTDEVIEKARRGEWNVVLTPTTPVPHNWFPEPGSSVLGLASAGGQQVPVLAAAGFKVTVLDNSPGQLQRDMELASRHNLAIDTHEGDMTDLSVFADETFDAVFNPCSTCFVPDVEKVYQEVARVLKKDGVFMTGITKPVYYLFDLEQAEKGIYTLRYRSPYSDLGSLGEKELNGFLEKNEPLVFGHTMEQHLNGIIRSGMQISGVFEDDWGGQQPIDGYFKPYMAIRAVKL